MLDVRLAQAGAAGWMEARRILAVRLDRMGDVLMATPAMRALRESGSGRRVTLLTSTAGAVVAPMIPELSATVVYDPPWMKATPRREDGGTDRRLIESLRAGGFEAAVIFTAYSQSPLPAALACFLADIPLRLAFCRENPYQLLTDWLPETEPAGDLRHEVRRQLDLVAAVGCSTGNEHLSLRPGEAARERIRQLLDEIGIGPHDAWVVIHPGASASSRRYPATRFAEVARILSTRHDWRVIVGGGKDEVALAQHVARAAPRGVTVAGRLSVEEFAALVAEAPLLIANNSGPAHLAAAVGTPVVDLYALTNPQHTPWGVPSRVLYRDVACRFCHRSECPEGHHACLTGVAPGEVVSAALELASLPSRPTAPSGRVLDAALAAVAP